MMINIDFIYIKVEYQSHLVKVKVNLVQWLISLFGENVYENERIESNGGGGGGMCQRFLHVDLSMGLIKVKIILGQVGSGVKL